MKYTSILFDLDGTLTDPKVGITKSVQYALRAFDIHVDDLNQLNLFIGPPLLESFKHYYAFNDTESKRAIELYREYFSAYGMLENEIYPGVATMLQQLREQGVRLFVATSKPTIYAIPILEHFQIASYFDHIVGSELDGTRSDKAEVIRHLLDNHHIDIASSVMIGDRKHDIIGARKNGMDSVAVGYGYGSKEELEESNPTLIVQTVDQLLKQLLE